MTTTCNKHKRYQAKRRPVSTTKHPRGCATCWEVYNERRVEEAAAVFDADEKGRAKGEMP